MRAEYSRKVARGGRYRYLESAGRAKMESNESYAVTTGYCAGSELIVSFMTLAEMRQGALDTNWGPRKIAGAGGLYCRGVIP